MSHQRGDLASLAVQAPSRAVPPGKQDRPAGTPRRWPLANPQPL